ncbi:MarR family winged helix-turn-helix transcriptional regulator [Mycolicibacterium arenosum]|uniref:MarR family transcriptional regulator n=1 Tax=Mycolicibacterium arenosum TaxID=2952157 RepID=A0ABT1M9B4_9MYCO|nr:MarR family transcriptional regulator [Mycolicibacterium sp. CAU 1645]MCP9274982.1 MarR family transcriptional regulator [Mycolicibacterium sp. CAU 1645]
MSGSDSQPHVSLLDACRDLARAMDQFDEAACAALGLGRSDLRALNLLEHGPLGASALADQLGLTRPAVTALIDRLADAGYAARVSVPGDRRATGIELQPATFEAFARVYRPLGERVSAATDALSHRDRKAALSAMTAVITAFHDVRVELAPSQVPHR